MVDTDKIETTKETLTLAVDRSNCYPGELVTIYLRFIAPGAAGSMLQLEMPGVLKIEAYEVPSEKTASLPSVTAVDQELVVMIPLDAEFAAGKEYLAKLSARINTFYIDQYMTVQASILDANSEILASASVRLAVHGKGNYLNYLPELYEGDDFTSRLLMMFESFWKPISQQIDQVDSYFDPLLTPPAMVPWLASWLGLPLDDLLPIERVRMLIKNAMMLFQCRGTAAAIKKYLEIFTDGDVEITERRARNFILGGESTLGVEVALGKQNQPNSVLVMLRVPEYELDRTKYSAEMYSRKIVEVVRTQVPAHVFFEVNCEFLPKA